MALPVIQLNPVETGVPLQYAVRLRYEVTSLCGHINDFTEQLLSANLSWNILSFCINSCKRKYDMIQNYCIQFSDRSGSLFKISCTMLHYCNIYIYIYIYNTKWVLISTKITGRITGSGRTSRVTVARCYTVRVMGSLAVKSFC